MDAKVGFPCCSDDVVAIGVTLITRDTKIRVKNILEALSVASTVHTNVSTVESMAYVLEFASKLLETPT